MKHVCLATGWQAKREARAKWINLALRLAGTNRQLRGTPAGTQESTLACLTSMAPIRVGWKGVWGGIGGM